MMHELTLGKKRGWDQVTTSSGLLFVLAIDHREDSLGQMLKDAGLAYDWNAMVDFKVAATSALAPHVSAVLLDPVAGIEAAVHRGALPGQTGLLVTAEDSGFVEDGDGGRRSQLAPGMHASKARRIGGQALKLLVYSRIERFAPLLWQQRMVRAVAEDCAANDFLLIVEPQTYRLPGESEAQYQANRSRTVMEIAPSLEQWGADVLKLEFPWPLRTPGDRDIAAKQCQALANSIHVPWALLSFGVDFETFLEQAAIAAASGCRGFIAGRALWKDAVPLTGKARETFLSTEVVSRLRKLAGVFETKHG